MNNLNGDANPVGRPSKYNDDLPSDLIKFFDRPLYHIDNETGEKMPSKMPTVERWCCNIGIVTSTFYKWVDEKPEFSSAFKIAKQYQKDHIIQMGLMGIYKEGFAKFVAINCTDLTDKVETEHSGEIEIKLPDAKLTKL